MKIKAEHITDLPPGSVVRIGGVEWVRLVDEPSLHLNDMLCNPKTGYWTSWQCLVLLDDEVEVVQNAIDTCDATLPQCWVMR